MDNINKEENTIVIGDNLSAYLREINKIPLLDPIEQKELLMKHNVYFTISKLYKKIIVGQYYNLMVNIAKKYENKNMSYETILSCEIYSLNKLVENNKFIPDVEKIKNILIDKISNSIKSAKTNKYKEINFDSYNVKKISNEQLCKTYEEYLKNEKERLSLRKKIAEHNLRLIIPIAKKYFRQNADNMDIIQEGNMGLLRAIDLFDPSMGNTLSTYSHFWINQYISRYLENKRRLIRLPSHVQQKVYKCNYLIQDYIGKYGIEPSDEFLKEQLNVNNETLKTIKECISTAYHASLNSTIDDDDENEIGNLIPDENSNVENIAFNSQLHLQILEVLKSNSPIEIVTIILRFGIILEKPMYIEKKNLLLVLTRDYVDEKDANDYLVQKGMKKVIKKLDENPELELKIMTLDGKQMTLEEIAAIFNITRERIRQIEAVSLRKLRNPSTRKILQDYLN